jgi:hypothetical protein
MRSLWTLLGALLWAPCLYADFGNFFVADKRLPTVLDSSSKKLSYRFTCQEDMTLTAAALFCLESRQSPAYLVTLQEDVKGFPSGEPLSSASYVPAPQSWSTLPMDPVPLLKGRVYHLVVEQDTLRGGGHPVGVIGPGHFASFLSTDVLNHLHPNDGSPDPNTDTLYCEDGRWRALGREPVYAVYGSGSHFQGNPYDAPGVRPIYGNDKAHDPRQVLQGQTLHFHCSVRNTSLAFRVKKQGNPRSPLFYWVMANNYRSHECHSICAPVTALDPGEAPADFKWVTAGLAPNAQTLPSECYYFVFQTDSGRASKDPPGCTDCYVISGAGNSGGLAKASDLTFDGGPHLSRAAYSEDGGSPKGWIDQFEDDNNIAVLGPACTLPPIQKFLPLPTPLPLDQEWGVEP